MPEQFLFLVSCGIFVYDWFELWIIVMMICSCVLDIQNCQWSIQVWIISQIKTLENNLLSYLVYVFTSEAIV